MWIIFFTFVLIYYTFVYNMKNRIEQIINYKSLTPSKFADIIGIQRSRISHIMSGRNNASVDVVTKIIEKFPDIELKWLMTGAGKMLSSENSLLENDLLKTENTINYNNISTKEQISNTLSINNMKKIERIIVFYTDSSFKEFKPE